ncbi:MAG: hypothetical protein KIG14_02455 [Candidatus Sacchiramonaceae bacterium]|nr:hypothetical protein [Candidatus Saccharimonadaceae bacterium]
MDQKTLEIPEGKRTPFYRLFEILPAVFSYGAVILMVVLSIVSPFWASIYLLTIVVTLLIKAISMAFRIIMGHKNLTRATKLNWDRMLGHLQNPNESYAKLKTRPETNYKSAEHLENLRLISAAEDGFFPRPDEIYNAVIIAAYNESYEVIKPTIQSLVDTTYDNSHLIIFLAYEERGGEDIEKTAKKLQKEFGGVFKGFQIVKHPKNLPHEVIGKGGNITHAGRELKQYCLDQGLEYSKLIVTTLDSDNKPHKKYFSAVTYEYIVNENRKHLSYQPVSLFFNNIWDVPAPMRVIATGNSFWNIVSSMRPHTLRNFASHSQPMDALVEMDFWSTRTIVEDGHQFWRSYFYFGGDYAVLPIGIPIYQDAVLSETTKKTLKAQFIQLRRWSYGASDVPYVAERVFTKKRNVPLLDGITKFVRLLDGHVSLAFQAIIVAFGGWIPLIVNSSAQRSIIAHQLPIVVSYVQQVAALGLFVTIFLSLKMLPSRPARYKKSKNLFMIAQWVLMPITSICYSSFAAYYAQTRLALGKYLDKFDVTEKTLVTDKNKKP